MYIGKAASILLTMAVLAGCSSSDDDGDTITDSSEDMTGLPTDSEDSVGTSMPAPGFDPNDAPQAMTQFDGNYLSGCRVEPEEEGIWSVSELSIQSDLVVVTDSEFSDSECTQPDGVFEITLSAVYPGGTADTSLGVADFIDLTVEGGTVNGEAVPAADEAFFDLILLDGGNLYFGLLTEELDGETPETRPTEIDTVEPFVRL